IQNATFISNFIFLGFTHYPKVEITMFALCLLMYLITLLSNIILISVSVLDSHLHTPMYFFLSNLSWCAAQMYFSLAMGSTECVLLYSIIMNKKVCVQIAAGSWVTGSFTALVETVSVLQLSLCGSSVINHFTCEILAVLKLACVDTSKVQLIMLVISVLLLPMPMLLICISYAFILSSILRISSLDGRSKAFSTCAAHLTLSMYLKPSTMDSQEIDKFIALVYAGLTPMLNPIIYSLRNREVKVAVKKLLVRNSLCALSVSSSK
uniref:G-protein coupled receptors family 1 profile domain-containing protein n=1 Tax=Capra hircus TaxID=9925 RepID=A0A452EKX0_CAPHI